ncbi:winged helix-turn-helix domain-containing protein [Glutamicibacter sp. JC586]|uniref:winged helix-turn-helix domain-containing protein n=1 Tax=Glutamicibacter sp. JC586 TaxID=2590552 RepID=UPI00135CC8AC|nr:winged helix-turn-helix domain-containing protein [Glutamicibacter sp. JC586]
MKQPSPALAPLLRSDAQGDLLAYLLLQPERESTLSEIARQIDAQLTTVHREVDRLVTSGLLTERRIGTARLIRANVEDRLYLPMRSLLEATYGPKVVLESVLAGHPDVESAFTFGSWGARYSGKQGASPNDLDVLIVGTLSRRDTYPLAQQVEDLLQMEVNAEKVDATQWIDGTDAFVAGLKSRPLVQLKLEMDLK